MLQGWGGGGGGGGFNKKKIIIPVIRSLTLKLLHSLQIVENHFGSVWKECYANKIENIEC